MLLRLFLLFTIVPLLELYLLIRLGTYIGALPTVGIVIGTGIAGGLLARIQGLAEIATRIAQYEMAYRMQASVPELTDLSGEPEHVFELYGADSRKPGTYAANCLLARRLAERGVRFIQLFHPCT